MTRTKIVHNLVMVTYEFGKPIFIAPLKGLRGCNVTPNKEDAEKWSEFDRSKLGYHKAITGYKQLLFETI